MPTEVKTSFQSPEELRQAIAGVFRAGEVAIARASVLAPSKMDVLRAKEAALLERCKELGLDPAELTAPRGDDDDIPF